MYAVAAVDFGVTSTGTDRMGAVEAAAVPLTLVGDAGSPPVPLLPVCCRWCTWRAGSGRVGLALMLLAAVLLGVCHHIPPPRFSVSGCRRQCTRRARARGALDLSVTVAQGTVHCRATMQLHDAQHSWMRAIGCTARSRWRMHDAMDSMQRGVCRTQIRVTVRRVQVCVRACGTWLQVAPGRQSALDRSLSLSSPHLRCGSCGWATMHRPQARQPQCCRRASDTQRAREKTKKFLC